MDNLYKSMTKVIGESANFGKAFAQQDKVKEYDEAQKKYIKTVEQAIKIEDEATKASNKQKDADLLLAKAKEEKRRYSKQVTDQAKKEIAEQKNEIGTLAKLTARNNELQERKKQLNLETKKGREELKKINKEQDANNKVLESSSNKLQKQKINIGNYGSAFGGLQQPIQMAGNALKAFLANPVVAIIAGIVLAFKMLINIFKETDDGGTRLKGLMEGVKVVFDLLKDTIRDFVTSLGDRFKILGKRFEQLAALTTFNKTKFNELGVEIEELNKKINEGANTWDKFTEAFKAAMEFENKLDNLNDRMAAWVSEEKQLNKEVEEYLNLAKDQTLEKREQLKFYEIARQKAAEYYGRLKKFENERFELETGKAALRTQLTQQQLIDFIKLGEKEQMYLKNNVEIYKDAWNILGDERIKILEELYGKTFEADEAFLAGQKRITSQTSGLINQILKESKGLTITRTEGYKLDEDAFKASLEAKAKANEEHYAKLKKQFDDANIEEGQLYIEKLGMASAFAEQAGAILGNSIADSNITMKQASKDLLLLTLKTLKAQIQQQLIASKIQAVAGAIASGESIATWGVAGLAKAAILVGLIEAAFVGVSAAMEKAIPSYFKGTNKTPSTFIAGDAPGGSSTEIVSHPTKGAFLVDKPTVFTGFEGARVIPEKVIKQDLYGISKRYDIINNSKLSDSNFDIWGKKIVKAIESKPTLIAHLDNNGIAIMEQIGRSRIKSINRKFNRKV
jgi:hypothetical protein